MKQSLSDSIDDYLDHLRSRSLASGTVRAQHVVLRRFLTVTGNILTENVHEGHVDQHFRESSKTRGPRSLGLDTVTLNGFFEWAQRTRRAGRHQNPMAGRKSPKFPKRPWRGVPVSKFPALLDSATHPRDRILLALGLYLLGRSVEFQLLKVADVNLEDGYVSYLIPKTQKADHMPICSELDHELRRWLTWYTDNVGHTPALPGMPLDPNWYLVPAKTGPVFTGNLRTQQPGRLLPQKPIRSGVRVAQKALLSIGFPVRDENGNSLREGMHTLRRSGARALAEQLRAEGDPNPIETVRSMLNHESEQQTRQYIGWESARLHRDARLRGRPMFPGLQGGNVVELGKFRTAGAE